MNKGGIRKNLLLLTLSPSLALLVLLFGYFSYQQINLLQTALNERGITLSRYLAAAAEFGVATGNLQQLRTMTDSVLDGEVLGLHIYDMDERLLLDYGEVSVGRLSRHLGNERAALCGEEEHLLVFCTPISVIPLPVNDYQETGPLEPVRIGRLEVTLSTERLMNERDELIARSAGIAFLVLLLALALTRRIEHQITQPLEDLTETVEHVGQGDLKHRLRVEGSGELQTLQRGVNAMIEALSLHHEEMEERIGSATMQLREALGTLEQKNHDLNIQRQHAESASKAKSQFLSTMSHEIRTPLSGMIGMLGLLSGDKLNASQQEYVHHLLEAASALQLLIDEILDFSRIEAGKLSIVNQPFSPLGIMEDVAVMLAPSAHHKELELILDIDPALPYKVMGDPLRFRQVLINLMGNAIKFTSEGHVLLRVSSRQSPGDEEAVLRFEVIDTGIGIAQDKLQLVFESFTQVDGSTTRRFEGSGLGMTISRELVKLMGGDIGVESELGKGSLFWFSLAWPVLEVARASAPILAGKHVLLYEPYPLSRETIRASLKSLGAVVESVEEESAVLREIEKQQFDSILLCENSSVFTQRKLAQLLHRRNWKARKPVLCHITFINGQSAAELFSCHIGKPVLPSRLSRILQSGQKEKVVESEGFSRPLTVLLAEDNQINAKVTTHLLQAAGHRVLHVDNGRAALEAMRHEELDSVLMDVRMPEMDGLTVTRLWREEERGSGRRLPIIALTANDSKEDRYACLAAGMDDFMIKPVNSSQLNAFLRRYC